MNANTTQPANHNLTLIIFSIIFFGWGLLTSLNNVLMVHLNSIFELDSFRSSLISFTFFATYFFISFVFFIISQKIDILNNIGYKYLTVCGLGIAAMGAYLFYPASALLSFPFFMFALIILASGITILQLAANTYIINLGSSDQGASRLNFVQALNSLGATLGPIVGTLLILKTFELSESETSILDATELLSFKQLKGIAVQLPYWLIATSLMILATFIFFLPMPDLMPPDKASKNVLDTPIQKNLWMATLGIFVYVGGEVTIGANLGNIIDSLYPSLSAEKSFLISSYWGLAMIGRFFGGFILRFINCGFMLFAFGAAAVILIISGIMGSGDWTIYLLVGVGFFNSIMFPGIFANGIYRLNEYTGKGASMLIMAIAGGAVIPAIYNLLAPFVGLKESLVVAVICYAYISFYGKYFQKLSEGLK